MAKSINYEALSVHFAAVTCSLLRPNILLNTLFSNRNQIIQKQINKGRKRKTDDQKER